MRFGLFGGAKVKRDGFTGDSHGYQAFIDYVKAAEHYGLESLFIVEHHFTGEGQVSASMNILGYLAAVTTRMRLGTAVVVLPWHNPVLVAEQIATLDVLSGGRIDFGVGKGYREGEFEGFCVPMEEATERFDEAMEVIRKAWSASGRFSHEGKRWKYKNVVIEPEPVQRPHPPFWMGAGSPASIRRAATEGYHLLLDQATSVDDIVAKVAIYREAKEKAGLPYSGMQVGVTRALQIVHSEAERQRALQFRLAALNVIGSIARPLEGKSLRTFTAADVHEDDAPLLGTPAEIIERLRRLKAGGVEYVLLVNTAGTAEALREFSETIMPHVR